MPVIPGFPERCPAERHNPDPISVRFANFHSREYRYISISIDAHHGHVGAMMYQRSHRYADGTLRSDAAIPTPAEVCGGVRA